MTSGRCEGAVPGEESRGPSCNKELESVTFERQHQYSSLFGRLEADQCEVFALIQSHTAPLTSTLMST